MPLNMKDDRIATDGIARVSEVKADSLRVHRVESGDILLPRRGDLDRRAYVDDQNAGWLCGTGSIRIRVDSKVNSMAVLYALASPQSMRYLDGPCSRNNDAEPEHQDCRKCADRLVGLFSTLLLLDRGSCLLCSHDVACEIEQFLKESQC